MAAGASISVPLSESQTHLGWTIGAGVEVGLTPNWTAKAEYLYVRLEDRGYVLTGVQQRLPVERLPPRRELSVLIACRRRGYETARTDTDVFVRR